MPIAASLTGVPSLHPSIKVTIPAEDLSLPSHCRPFLLQRLPPAVFLDPYAYRTENRVLVHPSIVRKITYLGLTELERAVGWTDPTGERRSADRFVRKLQRQRASKLQQSGGQQQHHVRIAADADSASTGTEPETEAQDIEASLRALALEHTGVLIELQPRGIRNDAGLAEKVAKAIQGEEVELSGSSSSRNAKETTLTIPLHARYLPPVAVGQGGLASASHGLDLAALGGQIMDPRGSHGQYDDIAIDKPELFWACEGDMTQEEAFKQGWNFVEPFQLLPQPLYSHVSFTPPFPPFNPHYLRFLRPNPDAEQKAPLVLRLPRGDGSLGPLLQLVTFGIIGFAALLVIGHVRRVVKAVQRVERGRREE
ncbi:hypothetical protein V8E36_002894 [Tilletia maclaganii]